METSSAEAIFLRVSSGVPVQPLHMDPETLRRFSAEGLPLPPGEREEIEILLKRPVDDIGNDLLAAIRDAGKWVEQETVADAILGPEPS